MAKQVRWTDDGIVEVCVMQDAETILAIIKPLESRVPGNSQARFGGGRMEKVLPPVGRHCRCKRTNKRVPVSAKNLARRLPYPDLAQFKLMAAVAEPTGLFLAGDLHPGNAADDPLYLPSYRRVREMLDQAGLLYAGDCKMAALETRGEVAANRDFYLTRLPLTGTVPAQFAAWVEAAVVGDRAANLTEIYRGEGQEKETLGRGYEFERPQAARVGE